MRPLLWKEMRDLRPWLALAAGSVIALQLLCRSRAFEESFMGVYLLGLMPLTATLASIALGAGQVARERHAHTLDFLLARPLPAATLVWTKFLAGSIALALLIAALVALGYGNPDYTGETGVTAIRGAVGSAGLLLALFPRFWFLYAIALLLSVLCDRTAKAAAALAVVALTFLGFALSWSDLAPFSGLPSWLPFFDNTGALVRVARDSSLLFGTGLPLCAAALLVTWAAATRLKHSPASYFGNRALLLGAAALIGAAVLAA
ncbi:MAG: hypothetical protein JWP63_3641, partial [Candidatus Solibacter sp.]|nr:hypothetical protein [Candidatus Solibacter sp.]